MQDHPKVQQDESGNLYLNFGNYGERIEVASFSGDGTRLLTVEKVGVAKVWDLGGDEPEHVGEISPTSPLDGTKAGPTTFDFETYIEAAALDHKGEFALLGLNDGTAGVFEVGSGERLSTLHFADDHVYAWDLIRSVAYAPDYSFVVVGFYNRCAGIWDRTGHKLIAKLEPQHAQKFFSNSTWGRNTLVSTVAVSRDNRYLFVGCGDLTCMVWDLQALTPVMSATEHVERILSTRLVGDVTTWVTTGGAIWRHSGGAIEKLLETKQHLNEAAISSDGSVILTRSSANVILKTRITGESELLAKLDKDDDYDIDRQTIGFISSTNSDDLFYPDSNAGLIVGSERYIADCQSARQVSISSDNSVVAKIGIGGRDGIIWHVASNTRLRRSTGYTMAQAISPDSRMIAESIVATNTDETVINIWSVFPDEKRIDLLQTINTNTHKTEQFIFSSDGNYLYSAGFHFNAGIRRWELQSDGTGFRETSSLRMAGLNAIKLLDNGNVAALREYDGLEVWAPDLSKQVCASRFRVDYRAERSWSISDDQKYCVIGFGWSSLLKICLETGETQTITPPYIVPDQVPDDSVRFKPSDLDPDNSDNHHPDEGLQPMASALLWRLPSGNFLHFGDGPRGWVLPLVLSTDGKLALVPCRNEIAVVSIDGEKQNITSRFAFEHKMRAGAIVGRKVLAVSERGRLFINELPDV